MKIIGMVVNHGFIYTEEKHLTVLKTSIFFANDGFTVYDCDGQVVFRVDSYARDKEEVVLMDANGSCLLTVRKKRPSLHQRWEGYLGERSEGDKPIFSVSRSSMIGRSNVSVEVYRNPGEDYQIVGCYASRSCTIFNAEKKPVAEIKRKVDVSTNVVLANDVFSLWLEPGFDGAFAMGLVLVLDQIHGDDYIEEGVDEDDQIHPVLDEELGSPVCRSADENDQIHPALDEELGSPVCRSIETNV